MANHAQHQYDILVTFPPFVPNELFHTTETRRFLLILFSLVLWTLLYFVSFSTLGKSFFHPLLSSLSLLIVVVGSKAVVSHRVLFIPSLNYDYIVSIWVAMVGSKSMAMELLVTLI